MLIKGIVKQATEDVILLTKLKRIIVIKKKLSQVMEVSVSLMKYLLQTQGTFGGVFIWNVTLWDYF